MNLSVLIFVCFTLAALFLYPSQCSTLELAGDIDARYVIFYSSIGTEMPNLKYSATFSKNFTATPLLVYGINNYKMNDQFYYQNFDSVRSELTVSTFSVNVTSVGSTNILYFSVSYMAFQQQTSFLSEFQSFTNGANISTGTGSRYLQAYFSRNFTSMNVYTLPLLTSFFLNSGTYYQINVTASVISTLNYQIKIETSSDCLVQRVSFYVLFCQQLDMTSKNYYYNGGAYSIQQYNDGSLTYFSATIANYSETVFLLGLRGFSGFTVLPKATIGWLLGSLSNDVATINLYMNNLQYIYYSFFQIGKYVATTSSVSSSEMNFLPIIAGIIVGIVILAVGVIMFMKFYWNRKILNVQSKDDFREMPSIGF